MAPTPHPHHQRPPNTHPPPLPPQHTPHSLQTPADLHRARTLSQARLKQSWERIFTRFSHDFTGIADEIDNATGALLVDNGHLRSLADANLPMDPADPDPEEDSFRIDKEEHCTQCADRDELDDAPCPHSDAPAETETVLRARGQGPTKEQILAWTPAHVHAHLSALSAQIDSCDLSFQLQKHNVSGRVLGGLARQELRSTLRLREEGVVRVVWGEVRRLQGILGGQEQEEGGAEEDKWAPPPRGEDPFYCAAWRDEHPDGTPEAFLRGKRRRGEEQAGGSKRVKVVRVGAPKEAAVGVGGGARKMAFEVAIPARTPTTTEQETPVSKKTPGKATPASRKHAAAETPAHAASSSKTQKSPTIPALKSILKKTGTPATAAPSEATTATTSTTTAKTPSKSTAKKTVSKSTPTPAPAAVAGSVTPITTTTTTTTKTAKVRTSISTPAAAVKESVSKAPALLSKTPLSKAKTKALSKSTTTAAAAATPTAGPASRTRTPAARAAAAAATARAPSPSPSPPSATTTISIPKTPLSKSRSTPTTAPKSTTKTQKPKTPKTPKTKHPKTPKAKISEPETPGWTTSIARSKLKGQSFLGFAEDDGGYEDELASPGADEKERMRIKRRRGGGGAEKETEKEAVGEVVVVAGVSVGGEGAGKDTTATENSAVATTTPAGAESAPTTPAADNVAEPARLVGGNRAPTATPSGAAGFASVEEEAAPPVVAAQKESSLEVISKMGGKSTRPPHACNKRRGFCFVCMDLEGEEDDLI